MTAQRMSDAELMRELTGLIGPTLTAFTGNLNQRTFVAEVEVGDRPLEAGERDRLKLAHSVLHAVAEAQDSMSHAMGWFMGANTGPDLKSCPAEAIRAGQFDDVRVSARRQCDPEEMGG